MSNPVTQLPWLSDGKQHTMPNGGIVRHYNYFKGRYRQAKPYNLELRYSHGEGYLAYEQYYPPSLKWSQSTGNYNLGGTAGSRYQADSRPSIPDYTHLWNKSYDKLRAKIQDSSSWGVNLAEWHQVDDMIASHATALAKAARYVRRFEFRKAAAALGQLKQFDKRRPAVSIYKSFGNNFLQYHFGIEPLMADIHDGIQGLINPVKTFSLVKAASGDKGSYKSPIPTWVPPGDWHYENYETWEVLCFQGCRVRGISDPTIHTLEQLGLTNPLSLAWELIPFSFVVDWFVNVGDVCRSFTDYGGLVLERQNSGVLIRQTAVSKAYEDYLGNRNLWHELHWRWHEYQRYPWLSSVNFEIKRFKPPSLTRGLTAVSLLLQAL